MGLFQVSLLKKHLKSHVTFNIFLKEPIKIVISLN
jgi:hypothetical protein